jgi:hypothetical protein
MCFDRRLHSRRAGALTTLLVVACLGAGRGASVRFYPDDPIEVDNDRAVDASGAARIEGSNAYDFAEHTFVKPGDRRNTRAVNVNTLDEVPDSSWFTNRIGRQPLSIDDIVRGPNQLERLDISGWAIVEEKSSGITPGYRVVDPTGRLYQIKFDPPTNPEMGSAAELIGAAFYHALGYNVVQGYLVEIDPATIVIDSNATTVDMSGRKRLLRRDDIDRILARAARQPNGRYRALASRFADGQPLGYFKYYGTRPDDPNDIHPHEHRRELRANRVFAAWLNHDDSRGLNTLDMLEGPPGMKYIRHYMFDFGSIMGSGSTVPQRQRAGNEYILEWAPSLKTLATLGLYVRPWITVDYPSERYRAAGRFEASFFNPAAWRPEYPNPAFDNMRADDAFWAARLVSRFSDEAIRAVVAKGRYTEPGAVALIADVLIERRDKVLRTWLTGVNPIVEPRLDADGMLTFENAAVAAGVASPPASYAFTWSRFDNASGEAIGTTEEARAVDPRTPAPPAMLNGSAFISVSIRTSHPNHPVWARPVEVVFRRTSDGWKTVGLERRLTETSRSPGPSGNPDARNQAQP